MTTIKLKRVYDEYNNNDGLRIFIDRLWPRGLKKENLKYDLWIKDISPSPELRKWFHEDTAEHWVDFSRYYKKELENSVIAANFVNDIRKQQTVTLLYAAKDKIHNHALVLKNFLEEKIK